MKYLIILFCLSALFAQSQQLYPPITIDGSQPWTNSTIRLANAETFIYQNSATQTSDVELKAAAEIIMAPDAIAGGYIGNGQFRAAIEPEAMSVVSFHPNGWYNIPRYDKFEMGLQLPASIQTQINAFLNGQPGLNPYDPDQVKVECVFNAGAHTRYGFYYRDYTVQNNTWVEQPTNYTFRIRLAPEVLVGYRADINLYINGVLTETITRYFGTQSSSNLGHLEMANGNLLKMQYNNGQKFFGVGQNVAYPIPDNVNGNCQAGDCNSPHTFQNQRDYLIDLADNGGNFTRVRLDALNMLCEWPYRQELNTDPPNPNKPLNSYLTNYNDNQRYLWEYDKTFATMENKGIKAVLCLLNDQNFSIDGAYDAHHQYTWKRNPYSTLTDTTLAGCKAFFTNQQAINTYRKWLYYVQARYGYSTSVAMWQMINETGNVASTYAKKHAIEDPTFNNDVKNWVRDMKFVLQQQYPIRPVTTGYVSDTNRVNIAYNLNIWSSNSYVGYVDKQGRYLDADYEGRAKTVIGGMSNNVAGYFPNLKPFFWGELGIGDSANIVDRKTDRNFHNAVWSSAFTGGISSGLYWNDWEQKYGVNHRKNFQALRAFVDMIDFNQRLEPAISKDNGITQYKKREIHTWYMANPARNYVVGWTKNNSANWMQDLGMLSQSERTLVIFATRLNEDSIAEYTCFSTNQNPETVVEGLLGSTSYKVKFYNTYDNANEMDVKTYLSSPGGKLTFRRSMYSFVNDPFNPDYAFIIKPASTWRMSQANTIEAIDTIYASTVDTLLLRSAFVRNETNYTYSWSGTSHQIGEKENQVKVNYPEEGTYLVDFKATSDEQDTTINQRFVIVVSDKEMSKAVQKIAAYPNPADNFLYLYYDNEIIKNPSISCFDVLGKEYNFERLEAYKFNTSSLPGGLYFVRLKNGNYEKVFKINITH